MSNPPFNNFTLTKLRLKPRIYSTDTILVNRLAVLKQEFYLSRVNRLVLLTHLSELCVCTFRFAAGANDSPFCL